MNLRSDDRNITGINHSRHDFTSLHISNRGSNVSAFKTCFDVKRDHQNENTVKSMYNHDEDLYCNGLNTRDNIIIPPHHLSSMQSEPRNTSSRASSQSICSRYLHTETRYPPKIPGRSKVETKINQNKYDINTKENSMPDPVQTGERYGIHEKLCSDKTTYCRPMTNPYHQELFYKTMEKNAKLQRLVKKLVIARQKEKEIENWNNYINDLRTKHSRDRTTKVQQATSLQHISEEFRTPDTLEDYYTTNFMCKQSHLSKKLLQDFYKSHDIRPSHYDHYKTSNEYPRNPKRYSSCGTNLLCYPTSSQGRLIMLEREIMKRSGNRENKPLYKTSNEERSLEREGVKIIRRNIMEFGKNYIVCNHRTTNTTLENVSHACTQTEFKIIPSKNIAAITNKKCNTKHSNLEKNCTKEPSNKETLQNQVHCTYNNLKHNSLTCIEEKLDNLIDSINNFVIEIKTMSVHQKTFDKHTIMRKGNVNHTRSDSCDMTRRKFACGLIDNSSRTTRNSSDDNFNTIEIQTIEDNLSKINDMLFNEIGKNKLITLKSSSIGETYHPISVQISVTIPTKEISTEVTRSLSKAQSSGDHNTVIEEIPRREDRRIAIAVNTDPLSVLAMLRVSTEETIKRLLSYVPTIDYYYYLSRLQSLTPRAVESQYVCNICGAAFVKPSVLTDHIQKHELGNTRDCCVCRHVLDLPRRRQGLFKCQYCGQRFTRAYCCELHQEACARRLGKQHDVTSSLALLR